MENVASQNQIAIWMGSIAIASAAAYFRSSNPNTNLAGIALATTVNGIALHVISSGIAKSLDQESGSSKETCQEQLQETQAQLQNLREESNAIAHALTQLQQDKDTSEVFSRTLNGRTEKLAAKRDEAQSSLNSIEKQIASHKERREDLSNEMDEIDAKKTKLNDLQPLLGKLAQLKDLFIKDFAPREQAMGSKTEAQEEIAQVQLSKEKYEALIGVDRCNLGNPFSKQKTEWEGKVEKLDTIERLYVYYLNINAVKAKITESLDSIGIIGCTSDNDIGATLDQLEAQWQRHSRERSTLQDTIETLAKQKPGLSRVLDRHQGKLNRKKDELSQAQTSHDRITSEIEAKRGQKSQCEQKIAALESKAKELQASLLEFEKKPPQPTLKERALSLAPFSGAVLTLFATYYFGLTQKVLSKFGGNITFSSGWKVCLWSASAHLIGSDLIQNRSGQ